MYFQPTRKQKILDITDDFAHLRSVGRNGNLEFEFFYKVSQNNIVAQGTSTVKVQILTKNVPLKPMFENATSGVIDTRQLVKNLRTRSIDVKSVFKQKKKNVVASKRSDITAHLNNEIIPQLRAGVSSDSVWQSYKTFFEARPAARIRSESRSLPVFNQPAPEFSYSRRNHDDDDDEDEWNESQEDLEERVRRKHERNRNNEEAEQESSAKLILDLITRTGWDPTDIFHMAAGQNMPGSDLIQGLSRRDGRLVDNNGPQMRLLKKFLFPTGFKQQKNTDFIDDDQLVQVLVRVPVSHVEVSTLITIPSHVIRTGGKLNTQFFVKFDLINTKTNAAIDSVTMPLDILRHLNLYNTPRTPPIVKLTKSDITSRAIIEIKQTDPGAKAVKVYKKNVYVASTFIDDYALVGTFNITEQSHPYLHQVNTPINSTTIYRIVPVGDNGVEGFEFTNIVLKPVRYKPIKAVALTAQVTEIGIKLEVRKLPHGIVAIEFKNRNLSIFEKEYNNVGGNIILVDQSMRAADFVSIVDREVSPNNIYEYVVKLIYRSGTTEIAGNAIMEFLKPEPGKVDTILSNLSISKTGDPDVTFNINTTIIDTNMDVVKTLLQKQGLLEQFQNDVAREREFLKKLIAHNVQRVNLYTGEREDFGVITTNEFSDATLRKNYAVQPLRSNNRYRYEVTALLRTTETMFETFNKEKVDFVTKKTYSFKPSKFQHPLALDKGVIVTSQGLKTRFSKEPMSYGAIGAVETLEVSFEGEPAKVIEQQATRFDRYLNTITWKLLGDINGVDHFVIMKDVLGVRSLIGKAHSEFVDGNCQYLHPVTSRDVGAISYVIVPVFNNYETGAEAITNTVIVEQPPVATRTPQLSNSNNLGNHQPRTPPRRSGNGNDGGPGSLAG